MNEVQSTGIVRSLDDGVQTLRFDRPEKKNAILGSMYIALAEALEQGNTDDGVRCHMLCGHPGAFTAGNDIADFLDSARGGDMGEAPVVRFLKALALNEKPIVAAVDGLAIGVGTTMLMHCDMVFATQGSIFKSPFVDLGLVPEAGSSLLGPAIMGHVRAFELLCLGEAFNAEQAEKAGLINRIVEGDVEEAAGACAKSIAAKPPEAMRLSRQLLKGDKAVLLSRVEQEIGLFSERLKSPEAIAAFQAFLAR